MAGESISVPGQLTFSGSSKGGDAGGATATGSMINFGTTTVGGLDQKTILILAVAAIGLFWVSKNA
jgi:hypothetical protein